MTRLRYRSNSQASAPSTTTRKKKFPTRLNWIWTTPFLPDYRRIIQSQGQVPDHHAAPTWECNHLTGVWRKRSSTIFGCWRTPSLAHFCQNISISWVIMDSSSTAFNNWYLQILLLFVSRYPLWLTTPNLISTQKRLIRMKGSLNANLRESDLFSRNRRTQDPNKCILQLQSIAAIPERIIIKFIKLIKNYCGPEVSTVYK